MREVVYNALVLREPFSGVETAVYELALALARQSPFPLRILMPAGLRRPDPVGEGVVCEHLGFPALGRGFRIFWEQVVLPARLRRRRPLLLHAPAYVAPLRVSAPFVLSVYDLHVFTHPRHCSALNRLHYRQVMPASVRHASRVLVPSRHIDGVLRDCLPEGEGKTVIAPLGVDGVKFHPLELGKEEETVLRARLGVPRRYLLFVGNLESRKNLAMLEQAFARLSAEFPDLELVICGQGRAECAGVPEAGSWRGRVRYTGYVDSRILPLYYQLARAFVFPTHDEGFGLPVLEALACGCPVICAAEAPAEFAGGALIRPRSHTPAALAEAIRGFLRQPELFQEKIRRGRSLALEYSWTRTAEAVAKVYRDCVAGSGGSRGVPPGPAYNASSAATPARMQ